MPQKFDPIPPAALSVAEACEYARISRASIYRLLSAPDTPLRTAKIGARRLILRESLDTMLASGAAIPTSPPKAAA
jgi:excisionase family DNA binding protein